MTTPNSVSEFVEIEKALRNYISRRVSVSNDMFNLYFSIQTYASVIRTGTDVLEQKLDKYCPIMDVEPLHNQLLEFISTIKLSLERAEKSCIEYYSEYKKLIDNMEEITK